MQYILKLDKKQTASLLSAISIQINFLKANDTLFTEEGFDPKDIKGEIDRLCDVHDKLSSQILQEDLTQSSF